MKTYGLRLLLTALLAGAVFMGWNYCREKRPDWEAERAYEQMRETAGRGTSVQNGADGPQERAYPDFSALRETYPDIVAWIWGPGIVIDYPVVQGEDNAFYLEHLADGTPNRNGAIFLDFRSSGDLTDPLTVLYGHHIRGGRMFSSLSGYKEQDYYEEHPFLYLDTPQGRYRLELFAGVVTDAEWETFDLGMSEEERRAWLEELERRSTFRSSWEPEAEGRFAALCTCTYEYSNARYVLYGQLKDVTEKGDRGNETDKNLDPAGDPDQDGNVGAECNEPGAGKADRPV